MTTEELHDRLRLRFGDDVGALSEAKVDAFVPVKRERIVEICRFLREAPELAFDFLEDLTAVDWPKRNVIEVVYHLLSYRHRHALVLKVEADRAKPVVASVEAVWKAANWMEREVYDLFGVTFTGHPDLRRVLLPDDWEGHPLRKDWQESGGYHGISNVRENPLVELRRLDEVKRAAVVREAAHPERSGAEGAAKSRDPAEKPAAASAPAPAAASAPAPAAAPAPAPAAAPAAPPETPKA